MSFFGFRARTSRYQIYGHKRSIGIFWDKVKQAQPIAAFDLITNGLRHNNFGNTNDCFYNDPPSINLESMLNSCATVLPAIQASILLKASLPNLWPLVSV